MKSLIKLTVISVIFFSCSKEIVKPTEAKEYNLTITKEVITQSGSETTTHKINASIVNEFKNLPLLQGSTISIPLNVKVGDYITEINVLGYTKTVNYKVVTVTKNQTNPIDYEFSIQEKDHGIVYKIRECQF